MSSAEGRGAGAGEARSNGAGAAAGGPAAALFAGPGEMRARCRALDWAATPLGPVEGWAPTLRVAVGLCLDAGLPTCLYVGPELVLVYNDAYRASLGAARHPGSLGRPGRDVWREAWDQIAPELAQVLAGGPAVVRQNQRFVLERAGGPDEAYFTYAFSPVRDAAGAVVAVHNASTETTAQIVAERQREAARDALAGERARLADIVRIAPAFMAVLRGPDHVIELTNAGYDALAGRRDVRGRPVAEALPEAAAQGFVALLDRVLATGEPFIGREVPYRRPDGAGAEDERFIDFVYQALTEADGTRSGVFVHGVDVTEQVRARREVERLLAASERARAEADAARRAAEAANRAKGDFLATMSHEIRTPINAALGYAELMQLGLAGPVTEQQKEYLGRLRLSSQHLLGLVNEVLDLSKAEAGQMTVAHEPAMTGEAIAAATALTLPLADTKGVRLVDRRPGEPGVPYVGDEQRVRQILVNLLSNAVKFTPPGGVVTVACDTAREAALAGAPSGPGPWAYIRVEDTGMGIAPEEQERVFDPFVQAEPGLTRTAGGTGLGLTISRRLARLMGGDLTVESRPGAGSAFTLWLPAGGADAARAAPSLQLLRDAPPRPEGLAAAGAFLRERLERVLEDYVERVRRDPTLPPTCGPRRPPRSRTTASPSSATSRRAWWPSSRRGDRSRTSCATAPRSSA
jgi:signal transduction histidine kinase